MTSTKTSLTYEEKLSLFEDGFLVVKNIIPLELIDTAKRIITAGMPPSERRLLAPAHLATHENVISLFKETPIADIMRDTMGPYPEVVSCQIAITPGGDKLYGSPFAHVDGSWSGPIPTDPNEIEPTRGRPLDPVPYFGENDDKRGTNDGQLWQDPERRISLGSYTALVGIALNDQIEPGHGQFAVLKGCHEAVEESFRMQRDNNSVIGPEGKGWPRIRINEAGHPHLNGLPETVRVLSNELARRRDTIEGWLWQELTPVCLAAGDAVIALHSCPHTATPNLGPNPRMNLYFRLRRWRDGNPWEGIRKVGHGVSDHPDRGYYGQFLDYPDDYDPWETSIAKLCDHWSDWDGMRDIVEAQSSYR